MAYSEEFGRGGNSALFGIEFLSFSPESAGSLAVTVEHKDSDETTWCTAGEFPTLHTEGIVFIEVTEVKGRLRFKYVVGTVSAHTAIRFAMLPPRWRP